MPKVNPNGRLWSILEETERREIQLALAKHQGNVRRSSTYLGVHYSYLYKRLKTLGIDHTAFADGELPKFPPPRVVQDPPADANPTPALTGWLAQAKREGSK